MMTLRWTNPWLLLLAFAAPTAELRAQVVAPPSTGPVLQAVPFDLERPQASEHLHLTAGQSVVLKTLVPIKRVYISDKAILESFNSGDQELVLTARASGSSGLVLWDGYGKSFVYNVSVDTDEVLSRDALRAAFPDAKINIESREGRMLLTGAVESQAVSDDAFKLISAYSKDVVNALRVEPPHGKQVRLKLRIVEVDRAKAEQFGFNLISGGTTAALTSTQQYSNSVDTSPVSQGMPIKISDPFNFFLYNYKQALGLTLKDLEQKQVLQVLAEPTLTTMSGISARFLSGGEFPVPVVQGTSSTGASVSIVYKPYGVKVDFLPLVNRDGTIHLKVTPEVSALDYTNAVTLSGTTVPALSTRRAETEVEIRDGESFVISGLLDHRITDAFSHMPGIASIPILGQLFRSKSVNHSTVELIVLVTAEVVDPLAGPVTAAEPVAPVPYLEEDKFDDNIRKKEHVKPPSGAGKSAAAAPVKSKPEGDAATKASSKATIASDGTAREGKL